MVRLSWNDATKKLAKKPCDGGLRDDLTFIASDEQPVDAQGAAVFNCPSCGIAMLLELQTECRVFPKLGVNKPDFTPDIMERIALRWPGDGTPTPKGKQPPPVALVEEQHTIAADEQALARSVDELLAKQKNLKTPRERHELAMSKYATLEEPAQEQTVHAASAPSSSSSSSNSRAPDVVPEPVFNPFTDPEDEGALTPPDYEMDELAADPVFAPVLAPKAGDTHFVLPPPNLRAPPPQQFLVSKAQVGDGRPAYRLIKPRQHCGRPSQSKPY